jgi:CHASE2 domain-containing sensor protein/class 3 adenylate cyclase
VRSKLLQWVNRSGWEKIYSSATPGLKAVAAISIIVTSLILGVKQFGLLQSLELRAYDRLVRLRPDEGADPRLLLVAITESDIQYLGRSTPADATLAQALANLEQHHPQVIGLDLYRDVPQEPGSAELAARLQSSRIIVITKLASTGDNHIPSPPSVPQERVGFNDLVVDADGVIRRGLLFGGPYYSFPLRLALNCLANQGIFPAPSRDDPAYMQLGAVVFLPLNKDSGGYQTIDDRGYQLLLNYRSSQNVAPRVTLTQVLTNQVNPDWIRNKIVLIGTTAPSGKDLFYTPYSAGERSNHQMSGVEVHAQLVSQILSAVLNGRSLIWFWTEWAEGLWILIWTVIGGAIAWQIRHPIGLGIGSAAILLSLSASCFSILMLHGWVPIVAPTVAVVLTTGTVVTYRAQQAQQQQQMVMTLLGQNTSPEIATTLWNYRDRLLQSGKLPGQRLTATILFTDIRGFSTISEQMEPEVLLEWLNEYLEAMTEDIQTYQGIVNKFTGDGLMAVFGVPIARTERADIALDAYRAVACALAMGDRLQQLNQTWQERGMTTIQMRIGIFTGTIVAGSLGGKRRLEYGVIGDSVNIASRLEGCAKERQVGNCRILIASDTLEYLEDQFLVEPWGPMELRGKRQLVNVYRVIDHAPNPPSIPTPTRKSRENYTKPKLIKNPILQRKQRLIP